MENYEKKQAQIERILRELIELLPSSYNRESTDTNYYKLLRALAHELADSRVKIEEVKENAYLDTVHPNAIYNNFGTLVRLKKSPEWDDEKYRGLIQGVIQSLLMGPTKESLIKAFKLFTNFNVQVYELYKDADKLDPSIYEGYNPKYTFLLEIEKPLDTYSDTAALQRDANYIIGILKPAHTIGLQITNLTDSEDFRFYYGVDRQVNNLAKNLIKENISNRVNELVLDNLEERAKKFAESENIRLEEALDTIYKRNYGMSRSDYQSYISYRARLLYENYLNCFSSDSKSLNINEGLIPTLNLNNFSRLVFDVLMKEHNSTSNAKMISKLEIKGNVNYEADIRMFSGENKTFSFIFNASIDAKIGYALEIDDIDKTIKLLNIRDNKVLSFLNLTQILKSGTAFNLKINYTRNEQNSKNKLEVFIDDLKTIDVEIPEFQEWHFGFQTGRDLIRISNFKINDVSIKEFENKYDNTDSRNFWSIPLQDKTKVQYGTWFEQGESKYLLVQGLMDSAHINQYIEGLYLDSIGALTEDDLYERIQLEKERLKAIYIKQGNDPSLIEEYEWDRKATESIKEELFRNDIIESLGGPDNLYNYCLAEASKFKDDYEAAYRSNFPYLGMDRVDVEGENINDEHRYGWKHLSHKGQLTTSIDLDGPKIGGVNLIGPRFTLQDDYILKVDSINSENVDVKGMSNKPYIINRMKIFDTTHSLVASEKENLESYYVRGPGYEETYDVTENVIEENINEIEFDFADIFEFSIYRNAFVLNVNVLNGPETWVDEEAVDRIVFLDVDLEEDIAFIKSSSNIVINKSLINGKMDVIAPKTNGRLDEACMEMEFGSDTYELDINSDLSVFENEFDEHYLMYPFRDSFMTNKDRINRKKIYLISPDHLEMGTEFAENIDFTSNTKIIINNSLIGSKDMLVIDKERYETDLDGYSETYNKVKDENIIEYEDEETFLFSKYRNMFQLNYDMLNDKEVWLDEEDVDQLSTRTTFYLEETFGVIKVAEPFHLNISNTNVTKMITKSSIIDKVTMGLDYDLEEKYEINENLNSQENEFEFEDTYTFNMSSLFRLNLDQLNTQDKGLMLGAGNTAELVLSRIDDEGNEVILETRII
ncbi:gp189 [Bacillus phage G]|uniref:Gp189 n=1 Tax=Bacillus phage G TaxID=2884420 RepID=G3MBQ5_9CAUD|nr:gp189 [Bacillus phage G]AEO93449.1 gp189 [Bacillus phage G]